MNLYAPLPRVVMSLSSSTALTTAVPSVLDACRTSGPCGRRRFPRERVRPGALRASALYSRSGSNWFDILVCARSVFLQALQINLSESERETERTHKETTDTRPQRRVQDGSGSGSSTPEFPPCRLSVQITLSPGGKGSTLAPHRRQERRRSAQSSPEEVLLLPNVAARATHEHQARTSRRPSPRPSPPCTPPRPTGT